MKHTLPVLIILIFAVFFGYQYYSETYVGVEAYAKVPLEIPEKKAALDMSGKAVNGIYSYSYKLTFVKKNGSVDVREIEISGETPTPLEPNSYVKAKLSKHRVSELPTVVKESSIPKEALNKLHSLK